MEAGEQGGLTLLLVFVLGLLIGGWGTHQAMSERARLQQEQLAIQRAVLRSNQELVSAAIRNEQRCEDTLVRAVRELGILPPAYELRHAGQTANIGGR